MREINIMTVENRYKDYDTWAWLYNQTMGPQYCKNQLQPLETLILPHLPQRAKILDLCCGTGHLVQQLLNKGYQVTGLDGSETMLAYALQNAPKGEFILSDARNFQLPTTFDAVFSTSASLNHIMNLEELKQVFRQVYSALQENGWFLFDLNHPVQMEKWWRGSIVEGEIEGNYAWALTSNYDPKNQTGYFKVILFQAPRNSSVTFSSLIQRTFRRLIYKLLSLKILTRFRLKLLSKFYQCEKGWQATEMTYFVKGYYIKEIKSALETVGFTDVSIQTLEGDSVVDNNHSAYFTCRKP